MSVDVQALQTSSVWPMNWALPAGVHAVCSTRLGGVSKAPYASLNLGDHVNDDIANVRANRELFAQQLDGAKPVFLTQIHGVDVVTLDASTRNGTVGDACITSSANLACTIMVADCLPLLFTETTGRVVAAAHAGWRGLAQGVVERTVAAVCAQAQVQPANVQAWLGPCIGPDAFEVGEDVRAAFAGPHAFKAHPMRSGKWLADLAGLARRRLSDLGVTAVEGNDSSSNWCTVTQASTLFSYRRDGVTGRFAASIWRC